MARKRISLTMKLDASAPSQKGRGSDNSYRPAQRNERAGGGGSRQAEAPSAMAAAFAKLKR